MREIPEHNNFPEGENPRRDPSQWHRYDFEGRYPQGPSPQEREQAMRERDGWYYYPQLSGMPGLGLMPAHRVGEGRIPEDPRAKFYGVNPLAANKPEPGFSWPVKGHTYGVASRPDADGGSRNGTGCRHMRIVLYRDELLYDIANISFVEGDIMDGQNVHSQQQTMDVVEEGNRDRIMRVVEKVFAATVEILHPFTERVITVYDAYDDIENRPLDKDQFTMDLDLPSRFARSTLNLVGKLIHEYIVCASVAEWLSITKPEAYERWEMKAQKTRSEIKAALTARIGAVRRRQSPF